MRLPYTPQASLLWNPPHVRLVTERRQLRPPTSDKPTSTTLPKSGTLLALDRALLHSPPLALGWNSLLGALRDRSTLAASTFELVCCRVAALNGSRYEWDQHVPLLRRALAEEARAGRAADVDVRVEAAEHCVRRTAVGGFAAGGDGAHTAWPAALEERHRAVLAYADAMTVGVDVEPTVWERLRAALGDGDVDLSRALVEVTAAVAVYNAVSRFLVALDVGEVGRWEKTAAAAGVDRLGQAGPVKAKL